MFKALAIAGLVALVALTYIAAVWMIQKGRARGRHSGGQRHYYRP